MIKPVHRVVATSDMIPPRFNGGLISDRTNPFMELLHEMTSQTREEIKPLLLGYRYENPMLLECSGWYRGFPNKVPVELMCEQMYENQSLCCIIELGVLMTSLPQSKTHYSFTFIPTWTTTSIMWPLPRERILNFNMVFGGESQ